MSKNLTRKGLAFGALVALGSTTIAGTPAFAIDAVSLEPSVGTSYNIILGEDFTLKSIFTDAAQLGSEKLAFEVTDASSVVDLNAVALNGADYDADSVAANDQDPTLDTNKKFVVIGGATQAPAANTLTLLATGTATASVVVKAFLDYDGDAVLDLNETVSATQTVKFVKASEVTATTAITAPVENDTAVVATVKFNDINNEQLNAAAVGANFTKGDDTVLSATAADVVKFNSAWSDTLFFKFTTGTVAALVKGTAVKVAPLYKTAGLAVGDTASTIGTAATAAVTARSVQTLSADSVVSTTQNASEEVALNKAFSVYAKTVDFSTPTALAIAGKTVSYSVTAANLPATSASVTSSTDTITINGVVYTNQAALPGATGVAKLSGVTNADGKVIVTGSSTGAADGDTFAFSFSVENLVTTLTLTEKTIAPAKAYITNFEGASAAVASGSSVALNIAAYDQFGAAMVDGYDARALWASSTRSTTATTNTTAAVVSAVVGGKATLTLPDAGAGTGTNVWNVSLIKRDPATGVYTGDTSAIDTSLAFSGGNTATAFTINFKAAADLVAGVVALKDSADTDLVLNTDKTKYVYTAGVAGGATTKASLATEDFGSYDARAVVGTLPAPTGNAVLKGIVKSTSTSTYAGVAIPGTTVTVAGAGLQFKASQGGADVWTVDSITVNADATGAFSVAIYSHKAGAQTVTVTSGAAKSVVDVNFADADDNAGTAVTITAPATTIPGRTIEVSALVADKFGNAINTTVNAANNEADLSVAYTGPGLLLNTVAQETDASGLVKFSVLLGATESGSATVTVKYDANGDADYADTGDIVKTATITIAPAAVAEPVSKIGTANGRVYVNVKDGKGSVVSVKINSKWVTKTALNNDYTFSYKNTKGKKVAVKVYVDGDLSAAKTITVK